MAITCFLQFFANTLTSVSDGAVNDEGVRLGDVIDRTHVEPYVSNMARMADVAHAKLIVFPCIQNSYSLIHYHPF